MEGKNDRKPKRKLKLFFLDHNKIIFKVLGTWESILLVVSLLKCPIRPRKKIKEINLWKGCPKVTIAKNDLYYITLKRVSKIIRVLTSCLGNIEVNLELLAEHG